MSTEIRKSQTVRSSLIAHRMGTQWTSLGHRLNKYRAIIAHISGIECPTLGLKIGQLIKLRSWHEKLRFYVLISPNNDTSMILLWYFSPPKARSIILLISLYINLLHTFLYPSMTHWHFFSKKTFTHKDIPTMQTSYPAPLRFELRPKKSIIG